MKVLLMGAGSVGQAYGYHLQRGGAEVSFLVRPKRAEECRRGFAFYALNDKRRPLSPAKMTGFGVLTDPKEAALQKWDAVFLCVPTTGLEDAEFRALAGAIGDATLVSLVPGLTVRGWILERFPEARLVDGMIALVAYPAPLPGETFLEPGTAYWFPPLSPSTFSGPRERRDAVVRALRLGGFRCAPAADAAKGSAAPGAILMAFVLALESSGWSFDALRGGDGMVLTSRAAKEAIAVAEANAGASTPARYFVGPSILRLLLALAPRIVPFDLEIYLRVHFTKVGAQMHRGLDQHIEEAEKLGLPSEALKTLRARLRI